MTEKKVIDKKKSVCGNTNKKQKVEQYEKILHFTYTTGSLFYKNTQPDNTHRNAKANN